MRQIDGPDEARAGLARRLRGARWAVLACLLAALLVPELAAAVPGERGPRPSFELEPASNSLEPSFRWRKRSYAARCESNPLRVRVSGGRRWRTKINSGRFRRGSFTRRIRASAGLRHIVTFKRRKGAKKRSTRRYELRCLPNDFPAYKFKRDHPGGPRFIAVQLANHYAAIFNRDGVPVWWFKASGHPDNVVVLADGTIAWDPVDEVTFQTGDYEVRTLRGRLLRVVRGAGGTRADVHELLLLPNSNYVIGAQDIRDGVDTRPHGTADSRVVDIEVQELTPDGELVWSWNSGDHIGIEETPDRWWDSPLLANQPYDISHWNSVEYDGRFMLLSFRHLDAVYKVNRDSGEIVWKLGGTETAESLEVVGDPHGDYPLGGQHDVRPTANGVTIYDNRTGLGDPPRAVRYRINEQAGRARHVEEVVDEKVPNSVCCGSARRFSGGEWLVGWGGTKLIGGYDASGRRTFGLATPGAFSYRANPVPDGAVRPRQLRRAMDAIARR